MRFSAGQTIGRYVVEALLGEGGMGEVYRAHDSRLERSVALKVLRNQTEEDGEEWNHAVMRMQREAKAVAALSHPNIVAIYDVGDHEGSPYIAMELVSGKPLRDLVGTNLTSTRRVRIMLDVAKALEAAHQADIVHRDVKPDNILVRDDATAKVLDFGIARRTTQPVDNNTKDLKSTGKTVDPGLIMMTAEGAIVGTPAYMSPEQLRGEPVDARADQFAWGVVAYELLAGRHPFHAEKGGVTLFASILGDTPEPLTGIPDVVAAVVMRALEKQPEDRWPSMHDVVLQWSAFISGEEFPRMSTGPHQMAVVATNSGSERTNPPAPHRTRRVATAAIAMGAVAAIAIAVAVRQKESTGTTTIVPTALSAQPPAGPLAVTDLPIPASESLEARAAFREGLQAIRDARWATASAAFDRARKADPGMAEAHLRFALVHFSYSVPDARAAFGKAVGLRMSLSERDQKLLHAVEPFIQQDPSDYVTASKRLESLTTLYPNDTELAFWHAHCNLKTNTPEGRTKAVELAKKCTNLDPKHADCWQMQSWAAKSENRLDEAVVALDQCIAASENAIDCLQDKISIDALRGRCSIVVDSLRKLTARDPATPAPRRMFTEALFYAGESEAVVNLATEEALRVLQGAGRRFDAAELGVFKAIAFGDFETASREMDLMASSLQAPAAFRDVNLLFSRVGLREEMGDLSGAARIADEFFAKSALRPSLDANILDPTMVMNAVKLAAGTMTKSAYEASRTAWLARHDSTDTNAPLRQWFGAYGAPANSKELAEIALAELDKIATDSSALAPSAHSPLSRTRGRLLGMVGRSAEALPYLEQSTNICLQGEPVLFYIQHVAQLGFAREATGDKAGACKSYQWLLAHWGTAKQSLTAKEVAKRTKSLGCESLAM
jgi:eukaryotic-like serine/threonine-protein kinase